MMTITMAGASGQELQFLQIAALEDYHNPSESSKSLRTAIRGRSMTVTAAFDSGCHGRLVRPCGLSGGRVGHTHW
ncbi:MAG: hypothetical protein JXQ75_23520, partial [Phycisphaerae bacterium]|nr:hypothetical protein [Phycisphaerae bacterium]